MLYSLSIYVAWYTMDNSKTSYPGEIDMGTWLSQSLPQPKEVPTHVAVQALQWSG